MLQIIASSLSGKTEKQELLVQDLRNNILQVAEAC